MDLTDFMLHSSSYTRLSLPESNESNSPFWYCDAGMNYVVGPDWRDQWDVVITSAGKPAFYTEDNRPFREVDIGTGKLKFRQVSALSFQYSFSFYRISNHLNTNLPFNKLDYQGRPIGKGACIYCWMPKGAYTMYQLVASPLFTIRSR